MDMNQSMQPQQTSASAAPGAEAEPVTIRSVTIIKTDEGRYIVDETMFQTIDEAITAAKAELDGTDSDEEAEKAFMENYDTGAPVGANDKISRY